MQTNAVRFWLGGKQVYGLSAAVIDQDQIVHYRGKYYLVNNEAPRLKRGKPLYHTEASLPAPWRKALADKNGDTRTAGDSPLSVAPTIDETVKQKIPRTGVAIKPSTQSVTDHKENAMFDESFIGGLSLTPGIAVASLSSKPPEAAPTAGSVPGGAPPQIAGVVGTKSLTQSPKKNAAQPKKRRVAEQMQGVDVSCPYCSHLERIPEKSATGKAGIHACKSCHAEFGLRITAQTTYQVEVAAFGENIGEKAIHA